MARRIDSHSLVQVLGAHGLNLWDESSGFEDTGLSLPVSYDTFVKLELTRGEGPAREVLTGDRTGTIDSSREPVFLRPFEFLAQPADCTLEVSVVSTVSLGKGHFRDKTIGVVSLRPSDLAQCPDGRVRTRRFSWLLLPYSDIMHLSLSCSVTMLRCWIA